MPPPDADYLGRIGLAEHAMLDHVLSCSATGLLATVRDALARFISATGADELMIASQIFDPVARRHSYLIAAEARNGLG